MYVAGATLLTFAGSAAAQEKNTLAVGGNFTLRNATDSEAHAGNDIGLKFRFGHGGRGWGWQVGLGWFDADVDRELAGRRIEFGEIKIKPLMVGYGYTYPVSKRLSLEAALSGGFAFTSFELTPQAVQLLQAQAPGAIDVDSGMVPVLRPEAGVWYDLGKNWGLGIGMNFMVARPSVTVRTSAGTDSRRLDLDTFAISAGLVYRIF